MGWGVRPTQRATWSTLPSVASPVQWSPGRAQVQEHQQHQHKPVHCGSDQQLCPLSATVPVSCSAGPWEPSVPDSDLPSPVCGHSDKAPGVNTRPRANTA